MAENAIVNYVCSDVLTNRLLCDISMGTVISVKILKYKDDYIMNDHSFAA